MTFEFARKIFEEYSNIEFNRNPWIGSWDRRTDMTKLIVALRNFANAPKHSTWCSHYHIVFTLSHVHITTCSHYHTMFTLSHDVHIIICCSHYHMFTLSQDVHIITCSHYPHVVHITTWCSHYHMFFTLPRVLQTTNFISYVINLIFMNEVESVYCAARTESLYKTDYISSLKS
jgi:hypothetical protein